MNQNLRMAPNTHKNHPHSSEVQPANNFHSAIGQRQTE
uniref:Uncharacterized protein n=1 Tax=Parascaris equorum TaxID=6256 RepID=A0A914RAC2_PAREQ